MAGEGGLEPGQHPLLHGDHALQARPLQEGGQQPAAYAPGKAVATGQGHRRRIQHTVDIDLLVLVGTVPAPLGHALLGRGLHGPENLVAQGAAADGIEGYRGTRGFNGREQLPGKIIVFGVDHMFGTLPPQQRHLSFTAHDIDQRDAVFSADSLQHLTQIGRRGRMDDGLVALHLRRLDKAQCGHGVHHTGGALFRGYIIRQSHTLNGWQAPVLGEQLPPERTHTLTH